MALGNFDGMHRGHQAVIGKAVSLARQTGKPASLLTFEPHPRRVFRPELETLRILSFQEKARRIATMGVDFIRIVHFTKQFSTTSADQFITRILLDSLHISHVVTGEDFIFGHNRQGNVAYLQEMGKRLGFGVTACAPVLEGRERCSSTRIRTLLNEGNVKEAAKLLGSPYSLINRVIEGDKRGRTIGFPTANMLPGDIFTPAKGVYAVRAEMRGQIMDGVANLGVRPTFGGERLQLEVHLFDWQENIYGERVRILFIERLRDEKKFSGVEALKAQIEADVAQARRILTDS